MYIHTNIYTGKQKNNNNNNDNNNKDGNEYIAIEPN